MDDANCNVLFTMVCEVAIHHSIQHSRQTQEAKYLQSVATSHSIIPNSAGSGYIAHCLVLKGVDVIAYDRKLIDHQTNNATFHCTWPDTSWFSHVVDGV
jgi:hypothetical protein